MSLPLNSSFWGRHLNVPLYIQSFRGAYTTCFSKKMAFHFSIIIVPPCHAGGWFLATSTKIKVRAIYPTRTNAIKDNSSNTDIPSVIRLSPSYRSYLPHAAYAELLAKVLNNPEMAALLTSLAKAMK